MYDRDGTSTNCINQCFQPCTKYNKFCSGKNSANYVYKISKKITVLSFFLFLFLSFFSYLFNLISPTEDGSCEVEINPVGCYKENKENLAMQGIFHNEAAPDKPEFAGNMLQFSDKYEVDFPEFLCRCARVAKRNGWEYFGVRDLG